MFDKFFQKKPRPKDCHGDCATVENGLLYLHKKVPEGEDPNRDKYTAGHYLKNFSEYRVLSNGNTIICPKAEEQGRHEVAVLEFLRLMIPGQPKARFVQDKNSNYYLDSKEVKSVGGLQPLCLAPSVSEYLGQTQMVKELYHKLNWEVYGSEQGFKRLGELNFIMHVFCMTKIEAGLIIYLMLNIICIELMVN